MPKLIRAKNTQPLLSILSFNKAGAVQNTWYEAFNGKDVSFISLCVGVTVANETLEAKLTIDGNVIVPTAGVALTAGGNCYSQIRSVRYTAGALNLIFNAAAANTDVDINSYTQWLKGRSFKIEIRKTTAAGGSAIQAIGLYHQY